jgi:tetratricopeptide (TPR) repeat protein
MDLALALWLSLAALGLWALVDFRSWVRFLRVYHQLSHEGRWGDVEELFQREFRRLRPWVRLVLGFRAPGTLDLRYAAYLQQRGLLDDALRRAEEALAKAGRHRTMQGLAQAMLSILYAELGRYDDAHAAAARARAAGADASADYNEALCCFFQGRLDQGLELARRAARTPKGDIGRGIASALLAMKGDYKPALEVLLDRSLDVSVHYTEDGLRKLRRTSEGRKLLEAHQQHWTGIVEPLRFIYASYVYLDLGDLDALAFTLEKAGASLGGHPTLRIIYGQLQACLCAGKGDATGADGWLAKGAEILRTHPRRASRAEYHRFAGRAALTLGRADAAVEHLESSLKVALHPMEKHSTRYWLAKAYEAKGNAGKAAEMYRDVAQDGIASKWSGEARSKASPPAPSERPPAS